MQGISPQRLRKAAALLDAGDPASAREIVAPLVARYPSNAEARRLLAASWHREGLGHVRDGRLDAARQALARAAEVDPADALLQNDLGACLELSGDLEGALACYQRACREGDAPLFVANLAKALHREGRYLEARSAFERLHAHPGATDRDRFALFAALQLPAIPDSEAEIDRVRADLATALERLRARRLSIASPEDGYVTPFFLSYHDRPNREIFSQLAALLREASPSLSLGAPHCRGYAGPSGARIRVGFISSFLHNHSIGHTTRGLVAELDRRRFEVVTLRLPPHVQDDVARRIDADSDRVVRLGGPLAAMRATIAAEALDVLFYQDIGMEPLSYLLAFARLAPVQCVSFGHPDTTGIDTVDWFVSGDLYERDDDPARDYSERLHLLRGVGTLAYYYPPEAHDAGSTRGGCAARVDGAVQCGDRDGDCVASGGAALPRYVCAQTLFKVHPRMDRMFGAILERAPGATIELIEGAEPQWTRALAARLRRVLGELAERIRFVPRMKHAAYLAWLGSAGASLDTIGFNGMNTSLEAFALGVPVVTLPTPLQRGRHTTGMYRRMGLERYVATSVDEYVTLAVRAGRDAAFRDGWRAAIAERRSVLYRDASVVRQFEAFFESAVRDAAGSRAGPG